MAFEIDHVGAIVDVAITSVQWGADATLFAVSVDRNRVTATPARVGPLIELLAEHGKVVSEEELIAMPFRFEFSAEALAALEEE